MSNPYELAEEELVRGLAVPPPAPAGVRQRVLAEALEAENRRANARRTAALTGTMVVAIGLVLGLNPASWNDSPPADQAVAAGSEWEPRLNHSTAVALLADRAETIATAGSGEWDQVEAFVLLRHASRIIVSGTP